MFSLKSLELVLCCFLFSHNIVESSSFFKQIEQLETIEEKRINQRVQRFHNRVARSIQENDNGNNKIISPELSDFKNSSNDEVSFKWPREDSYSKLYEGPGKTIGLLAVHRNDC